MSLSKKADQSKASDTFSVLITLAVILAVIVGGYFLGRSNGFKKAECKRQHFKYCIVEDGFGFQTFEAGFDRLHQATEYMKKNVCPGLTLYLLNSETNKTLASLRAGVDFSSKGRMLSFCVFPISNESAEHDFLEEMKPVIEKDR